MSSKNLQIQSDTTNIKRIGTKYPEPGQYWRCNETETLRLITEIKYIDNIPHTIILLSHPTHKYFENEERDLILYNEFVCNFSFEPEGEKYRNIEISEIQEEINRLQGKMSHIMNEPLESPMFHIVKDSESQLPTTHTRVITDEMWGYLSHGINSEEGILTAIQSGKLNHNLIEDIRLRSNSHLIVAETKNKMVKEVSSEINQSMKTMMSFYKEQAMAEYAKTAEARKKINDLTTGIQSLGLYLGDGIAVTHIREGARSKGSQPIHLFQAKRYIDEDMAIFTEFDNGSFDYNNQESFYSLVEKNPELVNTMIPVEKGLIIVSWRRHHKEYNDALTNEINNRENRRSWLLFRDGENVWAIDSPVSSHNTASTLFSTEKEMKNIFERWDKTVTRDSVYFADSVEKQENVNLHYRRFAILLSGLQDRLQLLGNLPIDASNGKLFLPAVQEKVYIFVRDAEAEFLIGNELPDFSDWTQAKNKFMQDGSRIVMWTDNLMDSSSTPGAFMGYNTRDGSNYRPLNKVATNLISVKDNELISSIPCKHKYTDTIKNITLYITSAQRYSSLSLLCLDMVTVEELSRYIHDRASRQHYITYLPLFKEAKTLLAAEEQILTPIKLHFIALMNTLTIGDEKDRITIISEALRIWRVKRRFKMPPSTESCNFKPFEKELCNIIYSLIGHGRNLPEEVTALMYDVGRRPLRLVTNGKNKIQIYATLLDDEKIPIQTTSAYSWVTQITIRPGKTKLSILSSKATVLLINNSKETTLHEWEDAKKYLTQTAPNYSLEDIKDIIKISNGWKFSLEQAKHKNEDHSNIARTLTMIQNKIRALTPSNNKYFQELIIRIPIGFSEVNGKLRIIYVGENAVAFLHEHFSEKEELFIKHYKSRYYEEMLTYLSKNNLRLKIMAEEFEKNWNTSKISSTRSKDGAITWGRDITDYKGKSVEDLVKSSLHCYCKEEIIHYWIAGGVKELLDMIIKI